MLFEEELGLSFHHERLVHGRHELFLGAELVNLCLLPISIRWITVFGCVYCLRLQLIWLLLAIIVHEDNFCDVVRWFPSDMCCFLDLLGQYVILSRL